MQDCSRVYGLLLAFQCCALSIEEVTQTSRLPSSCQPVTNQTPSLDSNSNVKTTSIDVHTRTHRSRQPPLTRLDASSRQPRQARRSWRKKQMRKDPVCCPREGREKSYSDPPGLWGHLEDHDYVSKRCDNPHALTLQFVRILERIDDTAAESMTVLSLPRRVKCLAALVRLYSKTERYTANTSKKPVD
jgi:hypothetical protein